MAIVPAMIFIKEKEILLFSLLVISLIFLAGQPLAMIKVKSRGVVEIKFIATFLLASIFWLIYLIIIDDWALQIFNALAMMIYFFIIYLYKKYKN